MNILLCSTGINALGETFTLALFAQELEKLGHKCFFIAPKLGKDYLMTFGFNESKILILNSNSGNEGIPDLEINKNQLKEFEKTIAPDYILVADWHHFKENGMSNNNTYSIYWFDTGVKMGTFDHVGFAPKGKFVKQDQLTDVVTRRDFREKEFPPLQERFSFIIRPCPHHDNSKINEGNTFYWGIYKNKIIKNEDNKQIINQYNISNNSKIVFQPIGLWQERVIDKVFEEINVKYDYYSEALFPIMLYYLSKVDADITYVVISGKCKRKEVRNYKNISFIKLPPLKHTEFMDMLSASDLFITDNLMSSNLGKAVFANILPLVFKNSISLNNNNLLNSNFILSDFIYNTISPLIKHNLIFPYCSFPIGLCELKEMYNENTFTNCFVETEIYNENENVNLLNNLLLKDEIANKIKINQNKYIDYNTNLLSAEQILKLS